MPRSTAQSAFVSSLRRLPHLLSLGVLLSTVYVVDSARIQEDRLTLLRVVAGTAVKIAGGFQAQVERGLLSREEAQRRAAATISTMRYFDNQYLWINTVDYRMVMHPIKPALDGQDIRAIRDPTGHAFFAEAADIVRAHGSGTVSYFWPRPGAVTASPKLSYVQGFTPWGWVIGTGVYVDDLAVARLHLAAALGGLGLIAAMVTGGAIALLARSVVRPLRSLTTRTTQLSSGDLDAAIPFSDRSDELGALARALTILQENSRARLRLEEDAATDRVIRDRRQALMDTLTLDFGTVISGVLTRMGGSAERMATCARDMSEGMQRTRRTASDTADECGVAGARSRHGGGRGRAACLQCRRNQPAGGPHHHGHAGGSAPRARDRHQLHPACRCRQKDRRYRPDHFGHCGTDQSARAQRHHRGGTGR